MHALGNGQLNLQPRVIGFASRTQERILFLRREIQPSKTRGKHFDVLAMLTYSAVSLTRRTPI